jgi:alkylation response protein AidB-like acyl-CoA dehydrogenase/ribonuclease HI
MKRRPTKMRPLAERTKRRLHRLFPRRRALPAIRHGARAARGPSILLDAWQRQPPTMSDTLTEITAHIDGASRGNPGPAAIGVVITGPGGSPVAAFGRYVGNTTNNVAEYRALLAALEYARQHGVRRLRVNSDSELMVRQMQGRYKVNSPDLKPLYSQAREWAAGLQHFSIKHVPREENREADRLANQALDRARDGKTAGEISRQNPAAKGMEQPTESQPEARQAAEKPRQPRLEFADNAAAPQTMAARRQGTAAKQSGTRHNTGGATMAEAAMKGAAGVGALSALSEEERMFQQAAYEFASKEVGPHVEQMDREGVFRHDLLEAFFEQGFMGIEIPESQGGSGGNFFMSILAIEAFARVDASAAVIVDVQNTLVANALMRWGNEAQKKALLPRLARDTVGAYALSEAASGSDAFGLETRAVEEGDAYVLNGRKLWITNAKEAGLFIVFATVNRDMGYRGITAFLVDRNTPGFSVGKKEDKLGIRASSTCELILEDCRVPKSAVLGEVGKGYKVAIETLNEGRIGIGAQMTGIAQGALDHAIRYSRERKQFGKTLSEFQAIQFQLARLATNLEAARLMTYNAARLKDAHQDFVREAAMAKYFCSQVAEEVASEAIEVFGGYGFTRDYPVEKYLRDSKIGKIYEGTSFMQLQTIAKLILG